MKLPPFTIHRPASVNEASRILTDLGDDAAPYCGGTELLLAMKLGLATYGHLIDLKRVDDLHGIEAVDGTIRISAGTTHHEIETSPKVRTSYPELSGMIAQVANLRVRSVGTLGGNLCFADPHSDPAAFLIAVGASLRCQGLDGARAVPAEGFLTGPYQTVLGPGDILTAVELPARAAGTGIAHRRMKLTERPVVTVTALVMLARGAVSKARLVVGSVSSVPMLAEAAGSLAGATTADFANRAAACAEQAAAACEPSPGAECSADYLRHLVGVFSRQALTGALTAAASHP